MAITIDGNSLVFEGTVTVTNFTNPTTGVCTLILTPSGGVGSLPALVQGTPGLPALFSLGTVTTLSPGVAATVGVNQTSAGGSGTNSTYTLDFGIPQGEQGTSGAFALGDATDLSGTAAVGDIPVVSAISSTAFEYMAFPWAALFNPSSISTISTSGNTTATLATVNIPAQPSAYYPMVFAKATVAGTTSTVVNLTATLNPSGVNQVVGIDYGVAGYATEKLYILPSYGGLTASSYGKVAANTSAVITLTATETQTLTDSWSINNSTVSFMVATLPVQ